MQRLRLLLVISVLALLLACSAGEGMASADEPPILSATMVPRAILSATMVPRP